jgi:hypothetical protein
MAEVLLISPEYLKQKTALNEAVEQNIIYPATLLAQDKYAEKYLGTDLFNAIKTKIDDDTLSGNYATLHTDYIKPMMVWATMVELYPYLWIKHDNGNLVSRISEDTQTIDTGQYKRLVDGATQNAQFYAERLVRYLCANGSLFPEYSTNQYPDRSPLRGAYNENSMIFTSGNNAISNPNLRNFDNGINPDASYCREC